MSAYSPCHKAFVTHVIGTKNLYVCTVCNQICGEIKHNTTLVQCNRSDELSTYNITQSEKLAKRLAHSFILPYSNKKCEKCDTYYKFMRMENDFDILVCPECLEVTTSSK